jgi:uncharacterized protein DUF4126
MTHLLAAILGISFSAGLNTYATVLALGLLDRFGIVDLPPGLHAVATAPVLIAAALLYLVEFVADKIPWFDTVWDGIHMVIRPAAGALLAYGVVGNVDPQWQVIAALAGGSIALTSHTTKASTRAAVNLSPEPFSNWFLSLAEDGVAFFLVWLVTTHPFIGAIVAVVLLAVAAFVLWKLSRFVRRAFRRAS